jgi:hypothetical protein
MKLLSKNELNEQFGKPSFWSPIRTVNLFYYLAGIEVFDELWDSGSSWGSGIHLFDITMRPRGLELNTISWSKSPKTGVAFEKIVSITMEDKDQLFNKKEKSVAGRAIVGGLLLGPVGAIVGGMSGLKGDKEVKSKMPDIIISMAIGNNPDNIERVIMFSCDFKKKQKAIEFLSTNLKDKFVVNASES